MNFNFTASFNTLKSKIPEINMPKMNNINFQMPAINLPQLTLPKFEEFHFPKFNFTSNLNSLKSLPESIKKILIPDQSPEFKFPKIKFPEFKFPELDLAWMVPSLAFLGGVALSDNVKVGVAVGCGVCFLKI